MLEGRKPALAKAKLVNFSVVVQFESVVRGSGVSRAMFGTCLPVRVCFFALKAASYLVQAFFFTEKYEPVGSYL